MMFKRQIPRHSLCHQEDAVHLYTLCIWVNILCYIYIKLCFTQYNASSAPCNRLHSHYTLVLLVLSHSVATFVPMIRRVVQRLEIWTGTGEIRSRESNSWSWDLVISTLTTRPRQSGVGQQNVRQCMSHSFQSFHPRLYFFRKYLNSLIRFIFRCWARFLIRFKRSLLRRKTSLPLIELKYATLCNKCIYSYIVSHIHYQIKQT